MGSIPLPALHVNPPEQQNTLSTLQALVQMRGQQQAQQMNAVQLEQAKRSANDQKILGQLMVKHQGNLDQVAAEAPNAGVSAQGVLGLNQHIVDVKQKTATLTADQLKNAATQNDNARGLIQPVLDAPPEKQPVLYAQARQTALQNPQAYGITDPNQIPEQFPGADALKTQIAIHMGGKAQADQALKEREVSAQETAANARMITAKTGEAKTGPMAPGEISMRNQQLAARYQVLNPGQPLPPEFTLQANAKRQDWEDLDKSLEQVEKARGVKAQQETVSAMRQQTQTLAAQNAADRKEEKGMTAVVGNDANGNRMLVSKSDADKMGLTGVTKADADLQNKSEAARHWLKLASKVAPEGSSPDQMGIMQLVDKMDSEGKLGPVAGRWNDFLAGKWGAGDPEVAALRAKMGLSTTKLMQAHVGSRGGAFMMEHFEDLANQKKMDGPTLKNALASELDYMKDVAMLPPEKSAAPSKPTTPGKTGGFDWNSHPVVKP